MPNSLPAEVRMGLFIEPTHMDDEGEEQGNEKEDERDGGEHKVESRKVSRQQRHADDTWMTCARLSVTKHKPVQLMCAVNKKDCGT